MASRTMADEALIPPFRPISELFMLCVNPHNNTLKMLRNR